MNRERQLLGPNSYTRELGFNPLDWLRTRLTDDQRRAFGSEQARWLDRCCGTGRAMLQAARPSDAVTHGPGQPPSVRRAAGHVRRARPVRRSRGLKIAHRCPGTGMAG